MKKTLLLIAALCCTILMHGESLYFKVNGTYEVTNLNVSSLDADLKDLGYITEGHISYDPNKNMLVMDGVKFATNLTGSALVIARPMTIVLWNTNTIPLIKSGNVKQYSMLVNFNTTVCGPGKLELCGINVAQNVNLNFKDCTLALNQDSSNYARIYNEDSYANLAFDNVELYFCADANHTNGHIHNFNSCTFANMESNRLVYDATTHRLMWDGTDVFWFNYTCKRSAETNYRYKFCGIPFGANNAADISTHVAPLLDGGSVTYNATDSTLTFSACTLYNKQADAPVVELKKRMGDIVFEGTNYINCDSVDYAFDLYCAAALRGTDADNLTGSRAYLTRGIQLNEAQTYTIKDMEMNMGYELDDQEVAGFPFGVRGANSNSVLKLRNTEFYIANTQVAGVYQLSDLVLENEQVATPTDLVFDANVGAACKAGENYGYDGSIHYEPAAETALDEVQDDQAASRVEKVLIDGQLLIIRDGKIYTIHGIEVK